MSSLQSNCQYVQTKQILVANSLCNLIDHLNTDVLASFTRFHDPDTRGWIEGFAVIPQPQNNFIILMDNTDIHHVLFAVLGETVQNHISSHLLHTKTGKGAPACVDTVFCTEGANLPGNVDHFIHTSHADINPFISTHTDPVRNCQQIFHVPRTAFQFYPCSDENCDSTNDSVQNV